MWDSSVVLVMEKNLSEKREFLFFCLIRVIVMIYGRLKLIQIQTSIWRCATVCTLETIRY